MFLFVHFCDLKDSASRKKLPLAICKLLLNLQRKIITNGGEKYSTF